MPTYRVTRVYVIKARSKAAARHLLDEAFLTSVEGSTEWLDYESIRELVPDEPAGGFIRQIAREAKSQLLGSSEHTQQPAGKNGQT